MEWVEDEIKFLKRHYPKRGREWCAKKLLRSVSSIRTQTSRLGLKQDRSSDFFKEWQSRAAQSKVGVKRPLHALKMISKMKGYKHSDESRKKLSANKKEWFKNNPHPKGMLGKKHSDEFKATQSVRIKKMWKEKTDEQLMAWKRKGLESRLKNDTYSPERKKCSWKSGWREIGICRKYYRSRWEANYARYLEFLKSKGEITDWLHEPDVFWFEGVKRGCVSYLPDFKVTNNDGSIEYHEVKGWMDDRSKTKIKRMAKYWPNIKLVLIQAKQYSEILNKLAKVIPNWE